jgi:HEPN domain-containing protein
MTESSQTGNSWKIFASAKQFFELVSLLTRTDGFIEKFPLGYFTNAAFTLELLLKCMISIEGKEPPKKHVLDSLFNSLDEEHKALILKHHKIIAEKLGKSSEEADKIFHQFITDASKDFVNARYFFDELKSLDSDNLSRFYDIGQLLQATYNSIVELKSEWKIAANVVVKNESKI